MRVSNYNILTDRLQGGGHVLLNSLTGMMELVSEDLFELLKKYEGADIVGNDLTDNLGDDLPRYLENGFMTEKTLAEEIEQARQHAVEVTEKQRQAPKALTLIPDLNCNYRCVYCFERTNKYMKGHQNSVMTRGQVDAFFRFAMEGDFNRHVTLYGGEPLNADNVDIVEYIVKEGVKKGFAFTAVSNGHNLDRFLHLLGKDKIAGLQVTLDGPKPIHDSRRIPVGGGSSYDVIIPNMRRALTETDVKINLRINVDKRNYLRLVELFDDLSAQELLGHDNLNVYASSVTGAGDLTITPDDMQESEKQVVDKYPQYQGLLFNDEEHCHEMFFNALTFGTPLPQRSVYCSSRSGMMLFSPDGFIYPCWTTVGHADEAIGTYDEHGNVTRFEDRIEKWHHMSLECNAPCLACKYGFLCSGGCCHEVAGQSLAISQITCNYYRYLFDKLLMQSVDEYVAIQMAEENK